MEDTSTVVVGEKIQCSLALPLEHEVGKIASQVTGPLGRASVREPLMYCSTFPHQSIKIIISSRPDGQPPLKRSDLFFGL